jgi:dTDP-4-dehydrorhamnose 3,5-epimerase
MALQDGSVVQYLCSTPYAPDREHGIHPLDPEIGIDWPVTGRDGAALDPLLSEKDVAAPGFAAARDRGLLPTQEQVDAHLATLRG